MLLLSQVLELADFFFCLLQHLAYYIHDFLHFLFKATCHFADSQDAEAGLDQNIRSIEQQVLQFLCFVASANLLTKFFHLLHDFRIFRFISGDLLSSFPEPLDQLLDVLFEVLQVFFSMLALLTQVSEHRLKLGLFLRRFGLLHCLRRGNFNNLWKS